MTIGSLFSGIGGLELGLESCGLGPVKWQAECDPYASAVLAKHWPTVKRYTDVMEIDSNAEHVDIICGGFPCQPHSTAGKRRGTSDERWLWPEFARIVQAVKPSVVFIENVPGLRTSGLRNVLADLASLGYDAEWDIFAAAEAGAHHLRKRLFIYAYSNSNGLEAYSNQNGLCDPSDDNWSAGRLGQVGTAQQWFGVRPIGAIPVGVGDGIREGIYRLKCLGNAVVPQQAALAWRELSKRAAEAK